ncbi:MAG: DUF2169 domain-containing protein [Pseudomonadota bacterium]
MKVIKEQEHGVLFTSYGVQDRYAMTVAVLTFFNLDAPEAPLKEQDMWKTAAEALGKNAALDAGMPKQHAEFLVCGKACAGEKGPVPAREVAVRVGDVEKRLHVFGERRWETRGGVRVITDPEPFTTLPLTWERAFGGPDIPENPAGHGIAAVPPVGGEPFVPLPNIETPGKLIGAPGDRPPPAGWLPIALDHPFRRKKAGTYGARWQRERWPYFPDDMDWTIFQSALPDQMLFDFFSGGEPVVMTHLHPERSVIETRVPRYRHRAFVWQMDEPWNPESSRAFREVPLKADTLWLFPHLLRGILVQHGTVHAADDEAYDVTHLYVATDPEGKPPPAIEAHFEKFQQKLDRTVSIDLSQLEEGKQKLREAMKKIADIPKQLDMRLGQMAGKHPKAAPSSATVIKDAQAQMDAGIERLGQGAARLAETKEKFGHLAKIDTAAFSGAQEKLKQAKSRLEDAAKKIAAAAEKTGGLKKKLKARVLTPENIALAAKAGIDLPRHVGETVPDDGPSWPSAAQALAGEAAARLRRSPDATAALARLGLRSVGRDMALLGLLTEPAPFEPVHWDMPPDALAPGTPDHIPAGLVMPRWKGADIIGIVIRTGEFTDPSSDVVVPGSKLPPLALGLAEKKPVLRVADPLEAAIAWQDAGDHVGVIALGGTDADPGDEGGKAIAAAPQLLITLYGGDDAARARELAPWQAAYPQAEGLPLPDAVPIFQSHQKGKDLETWITAALHRIPTPADHAAWGMAPRAEKIAADAGGIAIPAVDAKALVAHTKAAVDAVIQPKVAALNSRIAERKALVKKTLEDLGHGDKYADIDFKTPKPTSGNPFKKMDMSKKFAQMKKALTEAKGVPKATVEEHVAAMDKLEAQSKSIIDQGAALYDQGIGKINALKEKGPFTAESKALLAKVGIDPDDRAPMTREAVVAWHGNGRPFKGKNLQGLDLSGLDLPGIDLSEAMISGASFKGSNLSGARIEKTLAEGTDFTEADLSGAVIDKAMLSKAVFKKGKLEYARATGSVFAGADMSGTNLKKADLSRSLFEKATFNDADLTGATACPGYFLDADFTGATLTQATLDRSLFKNAALGGVSMKGTRQHRTIYVGGGGAGADFSGSDLHNMRIVQNANFKDADFTRCDLTKSSFMDAGMAGVDLRGSTLERAYIRNTDMKNARMPGVNAKKATIHRANLEGADLSGADLMEGRLRKSRITGADLRNANCYRTDFFQAVVGKTRFEGANLTKTLLHERTGLIDDEG